MNKKTKTILAVVIVILICGITAFTLMFFNGLSGIRLNPKYREGQIKVALVGDSVTYGHSIKNWPVNNYPAILSKALGDKYCVKSYGVSGSTVQPDGDQPYNITKAYTWSHEFEPDIIVLMLGSNDSKPENWKGAQKFREDYQQLLDGYKQAKNEPIIFICTPPTAFYPDGVTKGLSNYDVQPAIIEEIADIVKGIAVKNNCMLINVNDLTDGRRDLFGKDNVHPNNNGAREIAEIVYKSIINL